MEVVNTVGRRKAAVARVYVKPGKGQITINRKALEVYFPLEILQYQVKQPLLATNTVENYDIARVREIQRRIMQISTSVYTVGKYGSSYLKGVKCALSLLGVCDDYLSYPYRKFRTEERARIRQALEALGANCNV